jgi:hypothetical protein
VNRVDLPVYPALHVIGAKIAAPILPVIALSIVVLDLEVAILDQALRDDQIVRLVAAGSELAGVEKPERRVDDERRDKQRDPDVPRIDGRMKRPGCPAEYRETRHGCDDPSRRSGEHQQHGKTLGQPRQVRQRPEPEQAGV